VESASQVRALIICAIKAASSHNLRPWKFRLEARRNMKTAALNLRTAFINQRVEVAVLCPQFAAYLGLGSPHRPHRPDRLVRVGREPLLPKSYRQPAEAVIV
jgi:hypothetical protein